VWTLWYDDRLDGHVWHEDRELAYVRIDEALWHQGSALVNAEIKRRIEALEPPPRVVPPLSLLSPSKIFDRRFPLDGPQKPRLPSSPARRIGRCFRLKEASKITRTGSKLADVLQPIPRSRCEMEDAMRGRIMPKHSINTSRIFRFSPRKETFFSRMARPALSVRCSRPRRTPFRCRYRFAGVAQLCCA
jgi:hypothetical protein